MALPSVVLLVLAWLLFRLMLKPLRSLVEATSNVGAADSKPLPESGEGEVLQLIRAFNAMQERIRQLLAAGSQTLLAVGHDLRTPLARLQLRIDHAAIDPGLRDDIRRDIDEMRDLLQSLQTFVESGPDGGPIERIDIAVTARTLVDNVRDRGQRASYRGPRHLEILTRPVAVRRALSNLLENALAYGGNAKVEVAERDGDVEIAVEDDGPGIPAERLADVLLPFVRLDNARTRNTAGMGLGLPIVDRVVRAEGGTLSLDNKPSGGLRVTIRLPRAAG
jgi:signal transduction histidine kinase